MKKLIAALIAVALSAPASAGFFNGAELVDWCSGNDGARKLVCKGYIAASLDQAADLGIGLVCLPDQITTGEAMRRVMKEVYDLPASWLEMPAFSMVVAAANKAFPCLNGRKR